MQRPIKSIILITMLAVLIGSDSFSVQKTPAEPAQRDAMERQAQDAFKREDWESAVRGFEKLVKMASGNAVFHLNLWDCLLFFGTAAGGRAFVAEGSKTSAEACSTASLLGRKPGRKRPGPVSVNAKSTCYLGIRS